MQGGEKLNDFIKAYCVESSESSDSEIIFASNPQEAKYWSFGWSYGAPVGKVTVTRLPKLDKFQDNCRRDLIYHAIMLYDWKFLCSNGIIFKKSNAKLMKKTLTDSALPIDGNDKIGTLVSSKRGKNLNETN